MERRPSFDLEELQSGALEPLAEVSHLVLAALQQAIERICHCEPRGVDITLIGVSASKASKVTHEFFVRDRSFSQDSLDHYIFIVQDMRVTVFHGDFEKRKED